MELDSHANTDVLGSNCVVLPHPSKVCEVLPYSDEYEVIVDVPVVCGTMLWTDTMTIKNISLFSMRPFGWALPYPTHLSTQTNYVRMACLFRTTPLPPHPSLSPLDSDILIPLHTPDTVIYADT